MVAENPYAHCEGTGEALTYCDFGWVNWGNSRSFSYGLLYPKGLDWLKPLIFCVMDVMGYRGKKKVHFVVVVSDVYEADGSKKDYGVVGFASMGRDRQIFLAMTRRTFGVLKRLRFVADTKFCSDNFVGLCSLIWHELRHLRWSKKVNDFPSEEEYHAVMDMFFGIVLVQQEEA